MGTNLEKESKIYPDFSAWKENATKTKSGLVLAPENFYILDERGRKKECFTWGEAIKLEHDILKPAGWRLPTISEWKTINQSYRATKEICSVLNLSLSGIVWPENMAEYNRRPTTIFHDSRNIIGCYWSSSADGFCYANCLNLNSSDAYPMYFIQHRNFGQSIRCLLNE